MHEKDQARMDTQATSNGAATASAVDDIFTTEDLSKGEFHAPLGPAYFAARRIAEQLMNGVEAAPLSAVAKKCADEMTTAVYEYVEDQMRGDLELNLQGHISSMVERTVSALLTGEPWAIQQYALSQYHDGEAVRAAVAKHGGEPLLTMRIAELEKEVERLRETLRYSR